MAHEPDPAPSYLPTPVLVAPRSQHVLDGQHVTFEWEPVEGALDYQLQVASDTTFEELVLDVSVGTETSYTAEDVFPRNEQTYYWRVLARGETGWSGEDQIQSFLSAAPEQIHDTSDRPDTDEELGPAAELFSTAATDVAAEVTGDEERLAEEEGELAVEEEGVATAQITGIVVSIIVSIALAVIAVFVIVANTSQDEMRYKVATQIMEGYPDLRANEAGAAALLTQYEVLNAREGVYRIPIDRAISLMVNEAYDDRAAADTSSGLSEIFEY